MASTEQAHFQRRSRPLSCSLAGASGTLDNLVGWFRGGGALADAGSDEDNGEAADPAIGQPVSGRGTAKLPKVLPPDIAARCEGTIGGWCGRYMLQEEIPAKVGT